MTQDPTKPMSPSDVTIMRPRPGRRLEPPVPELAPARAQPAPPSSQEPLLGSQRSVPRQVEGPGASFVMFLSGGVNPLVDAAVPLLILAGRLRDELTGVDLDNLHEQGIEEVRAFEERARLAAVPDEDVLAARYILCTVVDEAILNTPWGSQGNWAGRSLLVTFHRESFGGEKVFDIISRTLNEPRRYLALLELLHICLSLGFEGRYRLDPRGPVRLEEIRQDLYRCIHSLRGNVETDLSPQWKGIEDKRRAVVRLVPLWVVAVTCAAVLLGAFIVFSAKLNNRSDALNAMLARIGREPLYQRVQHAAQVPAAGLRELLAPQIAQGLVSVTSQPGDRELVTITASELFESGSETVNPQSLQLIDAIGAAAEKVPGRYRVTGHTDDQPVHSFRFPDNYALSRARAEQVVTLLKKQVHDAGRLDFVGVGSSEPRYTPPSLPANRARNRRVEIVHTLAG